MCALLAFAEGQGIYSLPECWLGSDVLGWSRSTIIFRGVPKMFYLYSAGLTNSICGDVAPPRSYATIWLGLLLAIKL